VSPPSLTRVQYRFSIFEADPQSGELRKNGVRLKTQDQPFQILLRLLERPGQIVTREELKATLWSADTFVDFDNGLNMAVKRLREVLADDAEHPIFIETLPRRGYRFIAPVQMGDGAGEPVQPSPTPEPTRRVSSTKMAILASLLGVLVFAAIFIRTKLWSSVLIPKVVDTAQLTKDGGTKDVTLKLLSDGMRLYFQEGAYAGPESTVAPVFAKRPALVQVSAQGGETAEIPIDLTDSLAF
jgi:DNA-binding winged helix-turn-helix (wHTH) protein